MVQIPEYTRRENARPAQKGGINLNLPDALTNIEPVANAGKKALKLSSELADVFVNMKERRDEGIVSAFMNQYDKDSTQILVKLKKQYQGQSAQRVMSEFQKWRDNYITQHSSYDPDSAKEGVIYLEDEAQNRIAKQKLDSANVRDINSISSYIAAEEESFRKSNLRISISNNAEKIIYENHPANIASLKAAVAVDVGALHRGQSKQYIDSATKDVLDTALYGNIMRDSASTPIASIMRFQDKDFTAEMSPQTKEKARSQLLKSFIDYQANQLANAATGRQSSPAGEEFYKNNSDFFKGDIEAVKKEIDDRSIKIRNGILEEDHRNNVALQNDLVLQLFDAREKAGEARTNEEKTEYVKQMATTLSALSGVRGGVEAAKMVDDVYSEINDYDWLTRLNEEYNKGAKPLIMDGRAALSRTEAAERLNAYVAKTISGLETIKQTVHDINNGKYETLLDIPGFNDYSPYQKKEIMKTFAANAKYKYLIETAKAGSKEDFTKRIDEIYKNEHGPKWKNPVLYNLFKKEMAEKIVQYLAANPNKTPSSEDLQIMANNSAQTMTNTKAYDQLVNIIRSLDYGNDRNRDYSTNKKLLIEALKSNSNAVIKSFYSKSEEKAFDRAADYILDSDLLRAYALLHEVKLYD